MLYLCIVKQKKQLFYKQQNYTIMKKNDLLATCEWNYYLYQVVDEYGRTQFNAETLKDAKSYINKILKTNNKALLFIQKLHNISTIIPYKYKA